MDVPSLVNNLVAFLGPCLPFLLEVGKEAGSKAAETAGKQIGSDVWERAKGLWSKLQPAVETRPAVIEAARDAAAAAADEDALAALRFQLKKLLTDDPSLAKELDALWREAESAGVTVVASGDRSVAIGGGAKGATIITGDASKVDKQS